MHCCFAGCTLTACRRCGSMYCVHDLFHHCVSRSPDCEVQKHDACSGDAWDKALDQPTPCGCGCHNKEN